MNLIDIIRSVNFTFGIGDPTFFGWLTVVAYLGAAGLAAANAWRAETGRSRTPRWLWWSLALLLLFLAINKQLDLQSYLTAVGRAVARAQGWYELRGAIQFLFVAAVGLVTVAAVALLSWTLRDTWRDQWLTLVGVILILGFILIRASSFHYIDILIGLEIGGFRLNWVIELGAIAIFSLAAWRQLRRPLEAPTTTAPTRLDRRWRLAAFLLLAFGCLTSAGILMFANSITPDTTLEPQTRLYEGELPVYGPPAGPTPFRESFPGSPSAPAPWPETGWDFTIHSRDFSTWRRLDPMDAAFGPDCAPPPATHPINSYAEAVFHCDDQLVSAINATGFGAIYLTPAQLLDFSAGGTLRWQMSTTRAAPADWVAIWLSPYEEHLQLPLLSWQSNLSGPPRRAIYLEMGVQENSFTAQLFNDHLGLELPNAAYTPYDAILTPGRSELTTFELQLSPDHLRFGLPEYDLWWIDTPLEPALDWHEAVVQFSHFSSNPAKDCDNRPGCGPNSWQWDEVEIDPAIPFTMLPADQEFVDITTTPEVFFSQPAADDAYLRFAGTGRNLEVSFDGGFTWEPAQPQDQLEFDENSFQSFWQPVPAGTWYIRFRADNESDWFIRDIALWSRSVAQPD
ncbi:MAG: hypothetical protein KDE28_28905 [Anaerolineales bacterium]|nr:hypothetical protein [Anaerolineales bacterium]